MKVLLSILFLTLIFWSGVAAAQPPQAAQVPQAPEEFSGYAVRFQIRDSIAGFTPIFGSRAKVGFTAPLLMSRDSPPHYSTLVSMINLTAERHADEWDLCVSVTLPKGEKEQLASARLREAEKLKVERFAEYDLLPSEFSIVKIDPVLALEPEIVNLTSSIEVSSIKATIVPVPFRFVLKNNSSKSVQGLEINTYKGTTRRLLAWPEGSGDRPLIEPGGTYKAQMPTEAGYRAVAPDEYEPYQTDRLEIATVVFTDGSYEGNPHLAHMYAAKGIGTRIQLDRVLPLISKALDSGANAAQALANFKEAVWSLDVSVQPSYADELRNRHLTLDENELQQLDGSIGWGLAQVRSWTLDDLSKLKKLEENPAVSFRDWLTKEKEKYQKWRSQLR